MDEHFYGNKYYFWDWFEEHQTAIHEHLVALLLAYNKTEKPRTPAVFHECDYWIKKEHSSFRLYFEPLMVERRIFKIYIKHDKGPPHVYGLARNMVEAMPDMNGFDLPFATPHLSDEHLKMLEPFNVSFSTRET